jgi:head-tail adaptor
MPRRPVVSFVGGWPTLDVGRLVHAITIYQQQMQSPPEYDAAGMVVPWSPIATAMAAIEIMRGTDVIRSGQATSQLFIEVTLWWQPGIEPNMQIVSDNCSTYIIQSVENVNERNVVLRLNCLGLGANV